VAQRDVLQPRRLLPLRPHRRGARRQVRHPLRPSATTPTSSSPSARAPSLLLAKRGVRRGERVLIVLPDTPPFAWVFFGTLARGAVVAMGNPDAPATQIEYLVGYTRATAVVTVPRVAAAPRRGDARAGIGREVRARLVVPETKTGDDPEAPERPRARRSLRRPRADLAAPRLGEPVPIHRDEPAIWLFTSGSTGEPKANIHSHRDFAFNTEVYAKRTVGYRRDDVTVSVPRLFFGYATGTNLMFPFAVGATVGLFSERPTPRVARARHRDVPPDRRDERPDDARQAPRPRPGARARARPSPGSISRASASRSRPARRSPRRSSALARALRERRLRRHRLRRDVPHLRLEPPRRHQARVARQGGRGLRAPHPPRGRRGPGARRRAPRRDRRPLGEGRQREPRLLARSRQELEDVPRPLVQDGRPLLDRRRGVPLLRRARRRAPQGERALGRAGRGRGVPDGHDAVSLAAVIGSRTKGS
jgi:hypothetical protein